ncbi:hypothetical protein H1R20_g4881, partial [Candolleomyces eurysporus]
MFIASAAFTVILKPAHVWTLLTLNVLVYLVASATSVFDVVVVVVGVTNQDDSTMGYPEKLLRVRLSLGMITTAITQSLVIWRILRLWNRMTYVTTVAWFAVCCIATYGFIIVYWRESGSLEFLYGIYRKLRISFLVALGGLIVGRTYWLSRRMKKLYGPHFRPRAYTCLGAFVDSGFLYTISLLIDLQLRIHVLRILLPQMGGLASTCILYQEAVGRAAQDIDAMMNEATDRTNTTPVLDTIFSTPCVSLQAGPTRTRIPGSDLSSIDPEYNYGSREGDGESGLIGADLHAGEKNQRSRSVVSVITGMPG